MQAFGVLGASLLVEGGMYIGSPVPRLLYSFCYSLYSTLVLQQELRRNLWIGGFFIVKAHRQNW